MNATQSIFARLMAAHYQANDPSLILLPASEKEAKRVVNSGWPVDVPRRIFTGRPCKHGHVAPRQLSGYFCVECDKAYSKEYARRPEVRDRENAKARRQYRENPPTAQDKARMRKYLKSYRKRPVAQERHRKRMLSVVAERRAATPDWLTDEQRAQIKAIYAEAIRLTEETGIPHHVDHIIPLTHPDVQGLHCPWNLQILTAADNIRKSNSFDGTLDNEGWRV